MMINCDSLLFSILTVYQQPVAWLVNKTQVKSRLQGKILSLA